MASEAGLKHPLVHYYFPSTDDLFLALYRRTVEKVIDLLDAAIASEDPLRSLWKFATSSSRTSLAVESMALANQRKAIRREIARFSEQLARDVQYLMDRQAILDVIARHARGHDRHDVDLLTSAYHEDGIDEHGHAISPGPKYAQRANACTRPVPCFTPTT